MRSFAVPPVAAPQATDSPGCPHCGGSGIRRYIYDHSTGGSFLHCEHCNAYAKLAQKQIFWIQAIAALVAGLALALMLLAIDT